MSELLQFVRFKDLVNWSVDSYLSINQIDSKYEQKNLSYFLTDLTNKRKIIISDDIEYSEPTISSKTNLISVRKKALGKEFKVKKRIQIKKNDLVFARLHTQNGLFAFSDNKFTSTTTFIPCSFDGEKINKNYLSISLKHFLKYLSSNDSVGRETYKASDILNLKIPLPPLKKQQEIVKNYQTKINLAKQQQQQAQDKEAEIETYLYQELGIELPKVETQNNDILQFVRFKDLKEWDVKNLLNSNISFLSSQKFNMKKVSEVVNVNPETSFKKLDKNLVISFLPMKCISDIKGEVINKGITKISNSNGYTKFIDEDLIWARITPCMQNGKSAIIHNLKNGLGCGSTEYHVLRNNKTNFNLDFLYHILRTNTVLKNAMNYFTGSAGQQRVPREFLENLQIPLPPLKIQNKIVTHIQNLKNEIQTLKQQAQQNQENALTEFEAEIFKSVERVRDL